MGKHKIVLPLGYQEPEPTPLAGQDIQQLTRWAAMVHDPYMLIYCLRWGLGADPELLQEYAGDTGVRRKLKSFPNRCRRQLNRGERTVIGFDDLHKVFAGLLSSYFEIALLMPWGASSLSGDSRLAYPGGLAWLKEQCRQQEIAALDKRPFLSGWYTFQRMRLSPFWKRRR